MNDEDRYLAWRITYQSSEQAARAAFRQIQDLNAQIDRLKALALEKNEENRS